jgi:hypothetical protein
MVIKLTARISELADRGRAQRTRAGEAAVEIAASNADRLIVSH